MNVMNVVVHISIPVGEDETYEPLRQETVVQVLGSPRTFHVGVNEFTQSVHLRSAMTDDLYSFPLGSIIDVISTEIANIEIGRPSG